MCPKAKPTKFKENEHKEQQPHEEGGSTGPPGNVASSALVWAGLGSSGLDEDGSGAELAAD